MSAVLQQYYSYFHYERKNIIIILLFIKEYFCKTFIKLLLDHIDKFSQEDFINHCLKLIAQRKFKTTAHIRSATITLQFFLLRRTFNNHDFTIQEMVYR